MEGKLLSREEFEKEQKIQREAYEVLSKYNDFNKWEEYFQFEFVSYEEYLDRYAKFYSNEHQEEKMLSNTIEEE